MQIAWFHDFLRKNNFLPIIDTQNDNFSVFKGLLISWRHSGSYISGWYLLLYQWNKDVHTYTLVVKLGLYDLQYW